MKHTLSRAILVLLILGIFGVSAVACMGGEHDSPAGDSGSTEHSAPASDPTPAPVYQIGTPMPGDLRLTQSDDGASFDLGVGEEFLVSLRGSFSHTYRITEIDNAILEQVGGVSKGEGLDRGVFRVRAVGAGETTIEFQYGPNAAPTNRKTLTLHVMVK